MWFSTYRCPVKCQRKAFLLGIEEANTSPLRAVAPSNQFFSGHPDLSGLLRLSFATLPERHVSSLWRISAACSEASSIDFALLWVVAVCSIASSGSLSSYSSHTCSLSHSSNSAAWLGIRAVAGGVPPFHFLFGFLLSQNLFNPVVWFSTLMHHG
jgi:hypothetical protein